MAKYNLLNNANIYTLTSSGTGTKELSYNQLRLLLDSNTESSGISLVSTDVLYIEADLQERIKVDGIRLYAEDLTSISGLDFFYKDSDQDTYIKCAKSVNDGYYYSSVPGTSAPRYILTTLSGFDTPIYEFLVYNDDYIVGFGEDGTDNAAFLDHTPPGEEGTPIEVPIYNNSTTQYPANVYVAIDYTGSVADSYVKLAKNHDGPFYGISDGPALSDNDESNEYMWNHGTFDNVSVVNGEYLKIASVVEAEPPVEAAQTGTYTTPVLDLEDKYNATYYNIDVVLAASGTSVTKDTSKYPGTMEIRSSNTPPEPILIVYWPYHPSDYYGYIYMYKYNLNTDTSSTHLLKNDYSLRPRAAAVDWRRNRKFVSSWDVNNSTATDAIVLDSDESVLYEQWNSGFTDIAQNHFRYAEYSYDGNLWAYSTAADLLNHLKFNLTANALYSQTWSQITGLSAEYDGTGVWVVDYSTATVNYIDSKYDILAVTSINTPYAVAATGDGTCWASDTAENKLYKLDSAGTIIASVDCREPIYQMTRDYRGGFYARTNSADGHIYHYTNTGVVDMDVYVPSIDDLKGCPYGCIASSSLNDQAYYIDLASSSIKKTINPPSSYYPGFPDIFWVDAESYRENYNTLGGLTVPHSSDLVWGDTGSLTWKEVPLEGYFLPKGRFQQARLTLNSDYSTSTPKVHSITVPRPVKLSGIAPQTSQNIYAKTIIPADADVAFYDTQLKAWWDVME